jgi:hypothetical protein
MTTDHDADVIEITHDRLSSMAWMACTGDPSSIYSSGSLEQLIIRYSISNHYRPSTSALLPGHVECLIDRKWIPRPRRDVTRELIADAYRVLQLHFFGAHGFPGLNEPSATPMPDQMHRAAARVFGMDVEAFADGAPPELHAAAYRAILEHCTKRDA